MAVDKPASEGRPAAEPPRGVLRPSEAGEHLRLLPDPALAESVAHFWWVRWSVAEPTTTETLSHPSVHIVCESDAGAQVWGVPTRRFVRTLHGDGYAFGVKFRPGTFEPLFGKSLAALTDARVPIARVFGDAGLALERALLAADGFEAKIACAEAFLCPRIAELPPEAAKVRDLTERMARDRSLLRVEDAADSCGYDVRTLQRRFRHYVGVSPKWVIQRYRLHEAAEDLKSAQPPPLAELAARLGYFDQAHFAREFKAVIGQSPRVFAASLKAGA